MSKNISLVALMLLLCAACVKKNNTTINNNNYVSIVQPAFAIFGIEDVAFTNGFAYRTDMPIAVQYLDSAQQKVSISVSGLPPGVTLDTTMAQSGIPTYSTTLTFYDTGFYVTPGIYPLILTAKPDTGDAKLFRFNLTIREIPPSIFGKYGRCVNYCDTVPTYVDSIYSDPAIKGKIWFINFADSHNLVYGYLRDGQVIIPNQTVNGTTYEYTGTAGFLHHINMGFGTSCAMDMF